MHCFEVIKKYWLVSSCINYQNGEGGRSYCSLSQFTGLQSIRNLPWLWTVVISGFKTFCHLILTNLCPLSSKRFWSTTKPQFHPSYCARIFLWHQVEPSQEVEQGQEAERPAQCYGLRAFSALHSIVRILSSNVSVVSEVEAIFGEYIM